MIRTDTHLHTSFSSDSDSPMESMILKGIQLGLAAICFTDHHDIDFPDNPENLDFLLDPDSYYNAWKQSEEKYAGRIEILHGIELGIQPHLGEKLNKFMDQYGERYDFIIASCHVVDQMDPYEPLYFNTLGTRKGMRKYYETIYQNLMVFDQYQTVGHLDYAARYIKKPVPTFHYADYADILDEILSFIINNDKALEINTSGLKAGLPWPNPHMSILKRYKQLGGERITIGSDAHKPEHMAYGFHLLPGILKEAGFDHYEIYRKKQPFLIAAE